MSRWTMALLAGILLAAGCARVPFQEAPRVSLESVDPRRAVEEFQTRLPENFQVLNSVVFDYNWRSFLGIGYVGIDRRADTFTLVCLNPMGVKLLELSGDRENIVTHYSVAALTQYGELGKAVGSDIRRVYFDLVPSAAAQVQKERYALRFREPAGTGQLEYVFAGPGPALVTKNYYEGGELLWRVSYFEYREQDGKYYPQGIILKNYQHGYRLTVRQKDSSLEQD